MKWILRIFAALALLLVLILAGAWISFPWYAPALVKRLTAGKSVAVEMKNIHRPGFSGIRFGQLKAAVTVPADSCTATATNYNASILNGRLSWHRIGGSATPVWRIELDADSVAVRQLPSGIRFRQANPQLQARLDLTKSGGLFPSVSPDSIALPIRKGVVEARQLRLNDISYAILLTRSHDWVQQPALLKAESLLSGSTKTPVNNLQVTFGLQKNPLKPCTLIFSDCSLQLSDIRASTPEIDFNLRNKRTAFELKLTEVPLEKLSSGSKASGVTGELNGVIPVEYLDSTIRIGNGVIDAAKGTEIAFGTEKTTITFDAGRHPGNPPLISKLNAKMTLDTASGSLSAITLDSLSAQLLSGTLRSTPVSYDLNTGAARGTITFSDVSLLDRLGLKGEFSGKTSGRISGTIPFKLTRSGVTITNAKLTAKGSSTILQTIPIQPSSDDELFSKATNSDVEWTFSNPAVTLNRKAAGKMPMNIKLKSLKRKTSGGELLLTSPQGTLTMFARPGKPSLISLSGFSAGLLDGTVSINHMDYDLETKHTETRVQLSGIPIQSLLDLQGASKLSATGTIRAEIPLLLDNDTFSIPEGSMDAETKGTIIYSTTPEERAAAGAGMRLTYEALDNFFYSELISTISMKPNGDSVISIKLKGRNPDFQENRPVNLNLTIQQNLLDLFRSLTLSSDIEEAISKKALENSRKSTGGKQ
ncbi:MAG TPA: hypothetical protein ENL07_06595 [Chlorobaculum parvum]|uniref:Dicarboxylate transport domain-containing protein n=1 Tax=Chlorobaculum parvum TaxID=274539 RepID=A0A7C5DEH1_9CHLB|nr:hypothetical protein [Chlorobaculum parvum]